MTAVTILGPLSTNGPMFHVHAAGCADIKRKPLYRQVDPWDVEASGLREVVEAVYGDFIFSNDEQPWIDYVGDVRIYPCVHWTAS